MVVVKFTVFIPSRARRKWCSDFATLVSKTIFRARWFLALRYDEVMTYTVIYEKGRTSWGAYVPDLPGVITVGDSREERTANPGAIELRGAIEVPPVV
jgi:hypothetical protein